MHTLDVNTYYNGWEFSSLEKASNYYRWIFATFSDHLRGSCLEIGSGGGNFTRFLLNGNSSIESLTCLEPSSHYATVLQEKFGLSCGFSVVKTTIEEYISQASKNLFNSAVSINVLEHIEDDRAVVSGIADILLPGGRLCLVVPAHQSLYGSLDKVFGHYRRYDKTSLVRLTSSTALRIVDVGYMNSIGVLPWFIMGKILRLHRWNPGSVELYDWMAIPVVSFIERHIKPPLGQSIYAIFEKKMLRI